MIVVDASAVLELLLEGPASALLDARLRKTGASLYAPHLLDVEVTHVLRRRNRIGDLDDRRAFEALSDFLDLPIARYPHEFLLPRIWTLRHSVSAYDAAYLALAEALDAPLLTRDQKLARAKGHRARVEVV
ncbi:MAG TPA: type II toxin-antitoxin system VapC family toxin [Anaeromyxobacteraceae bacterium]|nr:type II toxin-antitoxin system VapC family toxin [Anaeromyxobacteraceae bacterium]